MEFHVIEPLRIPFPKNNMFYGYSVSNQHLFPEKKVRFHSTSFNILHAVLYFTFYDDFLLQFYKNEMK
jgi:hypothetical protein